MGVLVNGVSRRREKARGVPRGGAALQAR
jgi:hypothetical protein